MTDALTGLGNKFKFEEIMSSNPKGSILVVDIDYFKKINDSHGHETGDKALKALGQTIKNVIDEQSCAVRYGGEEFVVFVNGDEDRAIMLAEKLQKEVGQIEIKTDNENVCFTLSCGVAEIQNDVKKAFNQADRCLYYAKENGRNQVVYQSHFETNRGLGV
jgi:diguanylate cyclase (GGDEF)-like protein